MSTLVRAASLTNYVEVARQCGLDPWRLLREAGLPVSATEDPDLRIAVDSVRQLLEHSAAALSCQHMPRLLVEAESRVDVAATLVP